MVPRVPAILREDAPFRLLFAGQALGVSLAGYALDRMGFAPLLVIPGVVLPLAGVWLARALGARAPA